MLNRPGDAHGNIQFRRNDFARLTHLQGIGSDSRVHQSPRRTDRSTEYIGQPADEALEILNVFNGASAGNHHSRFGGIGSARSFGFAASIFNERRQLFCFDVDWGKRRRLRTFFRMSEGGWANGQELDRTPKFYSGNDITREHHSLENE